jgi:hypothetical protein
VDKPALFEHLDVGGDGRLRQLESLADLIDIERATSTQELQDPNANLGGKPFDDIEIPLGINLEISAPAIARHRHGKPHRLLASCCAIRHRRINPLPF